MLEKATSSHGVIEEKGADNKYASIPARGTPLALSEPNPQLAWEALTAYQRSAAVKAGVDLGVFSALGDGPRSAGDLAALAGVAERGMRILCDCLTVYGLITKTDGRYCHTPPSAVFLDSRSPASLAPTVPFVLNDKTMQGSRLLTETIRQNRSALEAPLAGTEAHEWVIYARTMQPMMAAAAEFMAGVILRGGTPAKVLDIAAGHGLFGIAVARLAPQCEIVALDFPNVLEVTTEHARAAGVAITLLPGSAFEVDLGTGLRRCAGAEFLPSFCHRGQHRFDETFPCRTTPGRPDAHTRVRAQPGSHLATGPSLVRHGNAHQHARRRCLHHGRVRPNARCRRLRRPRDNRRTQVRTATHCRVSVANSEKEAPLSPRAISITKRAATLCP